MTSTDSRHIDITVDALDASFAGVLPEDEVVVVVEHGFIQRVARNEELVLLVVAPSGKDPVVEVLACIDHGRFSDLAGDETEELVEYLTETIVRHSTWYGFDIDEGEQVLLLEVDL